MQMVRSRKGLKKASCSSLTLKLQTVLTLRWNRLKEGMNRETSDSIFFSEHSKNEHVLHCTGGTTNEGPISFVAVNERRGFL